MRRAVPILAAVLVLTACSQPTTGSPSGSDTGGSQTGGPQATTTSGKPGSTTAEPAKRPKTINVREVDPCTLLTEAQRTQFGTDQPPQKGKVPGFDWATCHFNRADGEYLVGTTVIGTEGIGFYTGSAQADQAEKTEVAGFPAVLIKEPGKLPKCTIAVDVSDGQMVDANVSSFGNAPIEELCRLVPQVAGAVVANLMAK
ncbi:DUF3558 domain-containing protein [Actinosynnema sp. NPDC047251]|uniref:Putative secreted protein n=1 Tax=Saccharothrix espanaensis (strain ATCC 51144 / DSM 44229 / JCM 9112 / NBRC 15066 / NRRL 15764) TaxID=1179773 RepID=K0KD06_SACES|nr:DUF3558 domain-containing protein [Saccharothrix espanaensis]CCH35457.1 putative secreted protein [Saccharothrix espanaensis DSM 44229]